MTPLTDDARAILAGVRADPDDDTPRLMYADYLDGLDTVSVPCPKCVRGNDGAGTVIQEPRSWMGQRGWRLASRCSICSGTGFVPDTSDRDRAELIRVQVRISAGHGIANTIDLDRQRELLAADSDRWRAAPKCGTCGGDGKERLGPGVRTQRDCPDCWGTGDAGGLMEEGLRGSSGELIAGDWLREVTYHRGMKRVKCRAGDVWEQVDCPERRPPNADVGPRLDQYKPHQYCPTCKGTQKVYRPTAWARAVCKWHPDVTEFWVTDSWFVHDGTSGWDRTRTPPAVVDTAVAAGLKWEINEHERRLLLGRAVVKWVHSLIK